MNKTWQNKYVWIIGASTGIGEALAGVLSKAGAHLILSARSSEKLAVLNHKLGGKHQVISLDVTDDSEVWRAAQSIGKMDSVLFLAATYSPSPLSELHYEQQLSTVDINLNGCLNVIRTVLPIMTEQGFGQIALCASVAGYRGLANAQPYSATKAALINLAESLYLETQETPIDIKLINPGFVDTPLTQKNAFAMPMIISPEEAASAISEGLLRKRFEIHFPKKFTFILKFLQMLPIGLYFKIAKHFR
jgi:short-subunit dehydrogenase